MLLNLIQARAIYPKNLEYIPSRKDITFDLKHHPIKIDTKVRKYTKLSSKKKQKLVQN